MGRLDDSYGTDCYETRELAWELQQNHADQERIRFLLDTGANLRTALSMARINEKDLHKSPGLKSLHLHKHLETVN